MWIVLQQWYQYAHLTRRELLFSKQEWVGIIMAVGNQGERS